MQLKVQLSDEMYVRFRDLLQRRAGLYYAEARRADLAHGLEQVLGASGHSSLTTLYEDALAGGPGWEAMLTHLTVGETRFFRNEAQFDALRHHVLPDLIERRSEFRVLRIWSAGCATGEEPYSLAILLTEVLPNFDQWNISILATDINPMFLSRAREALYGAWSFRDTADELRSRYFQAEQGRWRLAPHLRRMVTFARLNLAEPGYPALTNGTCALDIVVCRNVTIYFDAATTRQVAERFYGTLAPGGWLMVGHAEPQAITYAQFETHNFPNTVFYRKALNAPLFGLPLSSVAVSNGASPSLPTATQPTGGILPLRASADPRPPKAPPQSSRLETPGPLSPPLVPRPPTVVPARTVVSPPVSPLEPPAPRQRDLWATTQEQLEQGNKAAAEALLRDLLRQRPEHVEALVALGRLHADRGDWVEALQCCQQALAVQPLSLEASFVLAQVFEHEGQLDAALAAYRRVLYIDRTFVLGLLGMATVWRQMGRVAEARRSYRNLLKHLATLPPAAIVPWSDGATVSELANFARRQLATLV